MTSNAERFSYLVCELRGLLERYMEHSEDADENPVSHYALLNLLMSLQILERYALNDPSAKELFKSLYKKHKTLMDQVDKH
jgi:hypothetical protein